MSKNWSQEQIDANQKARVKIYSFIFLGCLFISIFGYTILQGQIDLAPNVKSENLDQFTSKLKFTLSYSILGIVWLFFSLWYVLLQRTPLGLNPLEDKPAGFQLQAAKNILTNSIEQFFLNFLCQLSLVCYLDGEMTKRVIPLLNILYILSRITFFLGYPNYRSFGFALSLIPTQIACWWNFSYFLQDIYGINSNWVTYGIPLIFHLGFHFQMEKHYKKKFD